MRAGERAAGHGPSGEELLSIGELARRGRVSVKTVRFYTDEGLLPDAGRSGGGHRRYAPHALDRLQRIRDLRAFGLPLPAVSAALPEPEAAASADAAPLEAALAAQLAEVGGQLAALRWREASLRALTQAPEPERPALLRLLGSAPQPPDNDALVRFWRRILPPGLSRPLLATVVDAAVPDPPGDPSPAQVVAYARLYALAGDVHSISADLLRRHRAAKSPVCSGDPEALYQGLGQAYELAVTAIDRGRDPAPGDELDAFVAAHAGSEGARDTPGFRDRLRQRTALTEDPRVARYWQHVDEVVQGGFTTMGTAHEWLMTALRQPA